MNEEALQGEEGQEEEAASSDARACPQTLVIGVGGAGCNIVTHIARKWKNGPLMATVDTDRQALASSEGIQDIPIGGRVADGMSAGGDAEIGRLAAEDDREILRDALFGIRFVVIVAGLGGGTGTGAAPVLAQMARDEGALTICLATMPFPFEGEKKARQAEEGLSLLCGHCDVVMSLPNEHLLTDKAKQINLLDAFSQTDEVLGIGLRGLCGILGDTGVVNVDFADLHQMVEASSGLCTFGYGEGTGPKRADRAANAVLKHPLLTSEEALSQADALLVNIVGGTEMTLTNIQAVMERIKESVRPDIHLIMGAVVNPSWTSKLAVTVVAALPGSARRLRAPRAPVPQRVAAPEAGDEETASKRAERKTHLTQTSLNFQSNDKGRFRNVEPTVLGGEDLDVPTYIRRGVKLSTDR